MSNEANPLPTRLVIAIDAAAAMDIAVELHAIGASVQMLARAAAPQMLAQVRQAHEYGVELYVCPLALAAHGLRQEDLIDEVRGQRGAAALLSAALAADTRFLTF